jgi:hypothetical protein
MENVETNMGLLKWVAVTGCSLVAWAGVMAVPQASAGPLDDECGQIAVSWSGLIDSAPAPVKPVPIVLGADALGACDLVNGLLGGLTPRFDTTGTWNGYWSGGAMAGNATLSVSSAEPMRATIDIPGQCGAEWTESGRSGSTVTVFARVTYGPCVNNTWTLSLTRTSISGFDPYHPGTNVFFRR